MNPENLEVYINGLQKTLGEKLFFLEILGKDNFFKNKIIVDFGCGDGSVLAFISKHYNCEGSILVGVDINEEMLELAKSNVTAEHTYFCKKLDNIALLENHLPVVFIASSVLHELGTIYEQGKVLEFVDKYADYFIVRDMCVTLAHKYPGELLGKLILNSNPKMLSQFVTRYGADNEALVHYLLKYTYVENWETEIKENYLSTYWKAIDRLNCGKFKTMYDRSYIQKWRAERVKKDFGIELSNYTYSTHRQLILRRKEKNDE